MVTVEMYEKALSLARIAHSGQVDKAGQPYMNHIYAVVGGVEDLTDKTIAALHDVVEDTDYTLTDLADIGFPPVVVDGVDCMTHRKGEPYDEYLNRIVSNVRSTRVKLSDLRHNMDLNRLPVITNSDIKRCKRYEEAALYLQSRLYV